MSQCDRILEILSDGEWHEKSEFYGFCVLHSRISELRKRGHVFEIEKRHGGRTVWYRLIALRETSVGAADVSRSAETPLSPSAPPQKAPGTEGLTAVADPGAAPLQLELVA